MDREDVPARAYPVRFLHYHEIVNDVIDRRRLDRTPARRLFTFAWRDDHGVEAFYEN